MNNICLGILAHVDSGKTSLCEAFLYETGKIKNFGRVDEGTSFLDTDELERDRGITIDAKSALISTKNFDFQLIDTPGHIDFISEINRCLNIIDYAILIISSTDNIKSYTKTLFSLTEKYKIPLFIFVNKMDVETSNKELILPQIKKELSEMAIDFSNYDNDFTKENFMEEISLANEELMNTYLLENTISTESIKEAILNREIFPVFFGSALKNDGIKEFLEALNKFVKKSTFNYPKKDTAYVYKISRDENNARLTHIKLKKGSLKLKQNFFGEKINEIRIIHGTKYENVQTLNEGKVAALVGLEKSFIGQNLFEDNSSLKKEENLLKYQLEFDENKNINEVFASLVKLNEEEPELNINYDEDKKEIHIYLNGEIQAEIIRERVKKRFGFNIEFSNPSIVYKESIENAVIGMGHFEPLLHYAEVILELSPLEDKNKIELDYVDDIEKLAPSTRNSIIHYLENNKSTGILTNSALTGLKIKILSALTHKKHTSGGDIIEATKRALRQGLMLAKNKLLEPYYSFNIELNQSFLGRLLNDLSLMKATFKAPHIDKDKAKIEGEISLFYIQNYNLELNSYTRGNYSLTYSFLRYDYCHNEEEIIKKINYNPLFDLKNPSYSVFVKKGESFIVEFNEVDKYIHSKLDFLEKEDTSINTFEKEKKESMDLMEIFERTYGKIKPRIGSYHKKTDVVFKEKEYTFKKQKEVKEYILIDGYNVIHASSSLKELAKEDIKAARDSLIEELSIYASYKSSTIILVFDAYKVLEHKEEIIKYSNIYIVYTQTAQTADSYIIKSVGKLNKENKITVVTSDLQEQIIIRSKIDLLLGSREFLKEMELTKKISFENFNLRQEDKKTYISEILKDKFNDL